MCLSPITTSMGMKSISNVATVMPINANLFGDDHRSVERATLPELSFAITLHLDWRNVFINLVFTADPVSGL